MTTPSTQRASLDSEGCYHCIQRCVRRAFLCGKDPYSGACYDHRKRWVANRLHQLGECFAMAIHAYAVMSNRLHVIVQMTPDTASAWSDDEVAARWVRLYQRSDADSDAAERKRRELTADPVRIEVIRARLSDLSWFMRCLAEPIARLANQEDGCKGRFWEGRYTRRTLRGERARLAAMVYVDLNPVRAGDAGRLDTPHSTSASERIAASRAAPDWLATPLQPIAGLSCASAPTLSAAEYLQVLEWTGHVLAPDERSTIPIGAPAILSTLDRSPARWLMRVSGRRGDRVRAAG